MCTVLLPPGVDPIAANKYTNINKDAKYLASPLTMQTVENADRVKESIFKKRRISICEVANMLQTSFVSVQGILKDKLDISQTATKFILWLMSKE